MAALCIAHHHAFRAADLYRALAVRLFNGFICAEFIVVAQTLCDHKRHAIT